MSKQSFFGRSASMIALAVAAAGVAAPAMAQESEEIVVTGSHLGKSAFNSPTPVNVIGDERMKALAIPSVADALNQIPSFRAIVSPSSNFFRVNSNIGARSMDLRGLGPQRTLLLVDGRRMVPARDDGTVDLNAIPSMMVKRSEVVTGGASAQYGADAVSGVVNLILDTKFTGFKTDFSAGLAEQGDAQNYYASMMGGFDVAGGRGHIIAGLEFQNEQGVGRCDNRDYCKKWTNYIVNPGYNATTKSTVNGLPANLLLDDVRFAYNNRGILISTTSGTLVKNQQVDNLAVNTGGVKLNGQLSNALRGLQWNDAGDALIPFQFGNYLSGVFMQGGDPSVDQIYGLGDQPLVVPTQHVSTLAHFDYDLTNDIIFSTEGMFSSVVGGPTRSASLLEGTAGIKITGGPNGLGNPYVTPAIRSQIIAADPTVTQLNVARVGIELGNSSISTSYNNTWRGVVALKGTPSAFKDHDVSWDASYTYGRTDGHLNVRNLRLNTLEGVGNAAYNALDAVSPPAGYTGPIYKTPDGRDVICAASIANPGNGCIPVNLLGKNSITPAMAKKYMRDAYQTRVESLGSFAANLRGNLFNTWAGPVKAAVGGEWRQEKAVGEADLDTVLGNYAAPNTSVLPQSKRDVTEFYVETEIPLLTDQPFAKNLSINGAKRWTHYSTSGDAQTWKAGAVYEPNDQILVRVTQSSDIRAPTAAELNPNLTNTFLPLPDPFANATRNIFVYTGGNPNLKNEESVTKTAGIVLKPSFIPGLRVSADYYNIKVAKAIDALTGAPTMTACSQFNLLCDQIVFTGAFKASPVFSLNSVYANLAKLHAEGAELVANYSFDGLGGKWDASVNANYVIDLRQVNAVGLITKLDGVTGNSGSVTNIQGVPQYKLDGVLTYSRDNWSVTAHGRYIPEGILDPTKLGPQDANYNVNSTIGFSDNRVDSAAYLDLSGTFNPSMTIFGGKSQLYGSISNVFDKSEPKQLRLIGNPLQFDPFGRAYRIGIRSNW